MLMLIDVRMETKTKITMRLSRKRTLPDQLQVEEEASFPASGVK
jgi:hypothetical protein